VLGGRGQVLGGRGGLGDRGGLGGFVDGIGVRGLGGGGGTPASVVLAEPAELVPGQAELERGTRSVPTPFISIGAELGWGTRFACSWFAWSRLIWCWALSRLGGIWLLRRRWFSGLSLSFLEAKLEISSPRVGICGFPPCRRKDGDKMEHGRLWWNWRTGCGLLWFPTSPDGEAVRRYGAPGFVAGLEAGVWRPPLQPVRRPALLCGSALRFGWK